MLRRLAVIATLVVLAPSPARADAPVLLDRVVAQVDATTIYRSDVVLRARPYLLALATKKAGGKQAEAQLAREVLARMIEEKLVEKDCARAHIDVEPHEVDRAIDEMARESKTDRKGLLAAAREEGLGEEAYRAEVRRQLLDLKWTSFVLRPRVTLPIGGTDAERADAERRLLAAERKKVLEQVRAESFIEVRS